VTTIDDVTDVTEVDEADQPPDMRRWYAVVALSLNTRMPVVTTHLSW